jgi:hypothetical protein
MSNIYCPSPQIHYPTTQDDLEFYNSRESLGCVKGATSGRKHYLSETFISENFGDTFSTDDKFSDSHKHMLTNCKYKSANGNEYDQNCAYMKYR